MNNYYVPFSNKIILSGGTDDFTVWQRGIIASAFSARVGKIRIRSNILIFKKFDITRYLLKAHSINVTYIVIVNSIFLIVINGSNWQRDLM